MEKEPLQPTSELPILVIVLIALLLLILIGLLILFIKMKWRSNRVEVVETNNCHPPMNVLMKMSKHLIARAYSVTASHAENAGDPLKIILSHSIILI